MIQINEFIDLDQELHFINKEPIDKLDLITPSPQ
jgi:hypothetical protein